MKVRWLLMLSLSAGCLTGCEVGPNYRTPPNDMPGTFTHGMPATNPTSMQAATRSSTTQPVDLVAWWKSIDDPELDSLIKRAVTANPDVQLAMTRLQESRTIEAVALSGALPLMDFTAGAGRGSGTDSVRGRIGQPVYAGSDTTGLREITQIYGVDGYWALDIFGKYRRTMEAVSYDTQAAAEARNTVLTTVVFDVARAYLDVRAFQARLTIANQNVAIEQQTVNLMQQRFDRGITNELDLALARRELAQAQSAVPPLQSQVLSAQRRVAVLLGQYSENLVRELKTPAPIPNVSSRIEPGMPVELLQRRADIRQAERQLAAATARIGVATANLFPNVSITAGGGFQGQGLGRPSAGNKFIWSAGPELYFPLLDFGALDSLVTIEDLRTQAALVNYRKTILDAVEEVNNAITDFAAQQEHMDDLSRAVAAGKQAVSLATQRYDRGLTDFLNELDAQRQYFAIEDQYAQAQEGVVLQFAAFCSALGGGWQDFKPAKPLPAPRPAIIAAAARLLHPDSASQSQMQASPHD
jgi:NodT family efflux transporter outer membrane factor (OMF) lipoprotein